MPVDDGYGGDAVVDTLVERGDPLPFTGFPIDLVLYGLAGLCLLLAGLVIFFFTRVKS